MNFLLHFHVDILLVRWQDLTRQESSYFFKWTGIKEIICCLLSFSLSVFFLIKICISVGENWIFSDFSWRGNQKRVCNPPPPPPLLRTGEVIKVNLNDVPTLSLYPKPGNTQRWFPSRNRASPSMKQTDIDRSPSRRASLKFKINARLKWYLKKNNCLLKHQASFGSSFSTYDHIIWLG